jgi:hypothetical protein
MSASRAAHVPTPIHRQSLNIQVASLRSHAGTQQIAHAHARHHHLPHCQHHRHRFACLRLCERPFPHFWYRRPVLLPLPSTVGGSNQGQHTTALKAREFRSGMRFFSTLLFANGVPACFPNPVSPLFLRTRMPCRVLPPLPAYRISCVCVCELVPVRGCQLPCLALPPRLPPFCKPIPPSAAFPAACIVLITFRPLLDVNQHPPPHASISISSHRRSRA